MPMGPAKNAYRGTNLIRLANFKRNFLQVQKKCGRMCVSENCSARLACAKDSFRVSAECAISKDRARKYLRVRAERYASERKDCVKSTGKNPLTFRRVGRTI